MTTSLGQADILRALIAALGGTVPASAGLTELWKALYAAQTTPVTNPSFGLTDSYRNVITGFGGVPPTSCGESELFKVLAALAPAAAVSQADEIAVSGQVSR